MALNTNIVAYWKLDESSGNASDSVWSNTLINTWTVTYWICKINNWATFWSSNTTKKLDITSNLWITSWASDFTISFWHRTTVTNVINAPIQYIYGWWTRQLNFIYDWANTRWAVWTWAFATSSTPAHSISSNTWYHIAIVCSSWTITWYENTVSQWTITNTATTWKTDSFSLSWGNTWYNQWDLDEVWVWSRALSWSEISQLYNSWTWLQYPFPTSTNPSFFLNFI